MRTGTGLLAVMAVAALVILPSRVTAFESMPPGGSPHDDITAEAASARGWGGDGLAALQHAVLRPDVDEVRFEKRDDRKPVLDARDAFDPSHHCDRVPPASDGQAFAAASSYVVSSRDEAVSAAVAADARGAVWALGRALHALQDCYSHSDIVEKAPDVQDAFQAALLGGGPSVPGAVRFTSFLPDAPLPEEPDGDGYPHGRFAKDAADATPDAEAVLPDGRTKFEAAYDLAVAATGVFLDGFLERLNETQKAAVWSVDPEKQEKAGFAAGTAWCVLVAIVFAVAGRMRRAA